MTSRKTSAKANVSHTAAQALAKAQELLAARKYDEALSALNHPGLQAGDLASQSKALQGRIIAAKEQHTLNIASDTFFQSLNHHPERRQAAE